MRPTTALAILLPAVLASCVSSHTAQHMADIAPYVGAHTAQHMVDIDRVVGMRQDYGPAAPEPGRSVQAQSCIGPMVPVTGNLVCE